METKTKDSRMFSLLVLYDMHSDFFNRALDGIPEQETHNRLHTKANHIAWLTGSLVQERFELAKTLGIDKKQGAHDLFKDHQGIKDDTTYPELNAFKKDWEIISPLLRSALANLSTELLDSSFEMMPGEKMTYFQLITFITYREANCIGQIALWRRLLNLPAINYM